MEIPYPTEEHIDDMDEDFDEDDPFDIEDFDEDDEEWEHERQERHGWEQV